MFSRADINEITIADAREIIRYAVNEAGRQGLLWRIVNGDGVDDIIDATLRLLYEAGNYWGFEEGRDYSRQFEDRELLR